MLDSVLAEQCRYFLALTTDIDSCGLSCSLYVEPFKLHLHSNCEVSVKEKSGFAISLYFLLVRLLRITWLMTSVSVSGWCFGVVYHLFMLYDLTGI